jgi:hypothetical protein
VEYFDLTPRQIREIEEIVLENQAQLLEKWREIMGNDEVDDDKSE